MLPASHHWAFAIAAIKWARTLVSFIVLGLMLGMARAAGINPDQPIRVDGIELFFGFVPAEILRGHPREHEEQTMHGGVPGGRGVHHLIISVFDAKTRARITDAALTGSVTEVGMATQNKKLEAMSFGGAMSYGNYFTMPGQGPYEIVVNVRRTGNIKAATASFQYWQPRR
ncbi:MAG: hypothetical protein ABIP67_17445 [Burkholderiales bacterium]